MNYSQKFISVGVSNHLEQVHPKEIQEMYERYKEIERFKNIKMHVSTALNDLNNNHFKKYTKHYGITTIQSRIKPDEIVQKVKERIAILGRHYIRECFIEPKVEPHDYLVDRETLDEYYSFLYDFVVNVSCLYQLFGMNEKVEELKHFPKMSSLLKTESKINNIPKIEELISETYDYFWNENGDNNSELIEQLKQFEMNLNATPSPQITTPSPALKPTNNLNSVNDTNSANCSTELKSSCNMEDVEKKPKLVKVQNQQKTNENEIENIIQMKDKEIEELKKENELLKKQLEEQMNLVKQLQSQIDEMK